MTVIQWTLIAGIIGVPVGFIFGITFIMMIIVNTCADLKEIFLYYVAIQIGSPLFMMVMMFVCLAWFSLFSNELNMW